MLIFQVSFLRQERLRRMSIAMGSLSDSGAWRGIFRLMFEILPSQIHHVGYVLDSLYECGPFTPLVIHTLLMHSLQKGWGNEDFRSDDIGYLGAEEEIVP